MSWRCVEAPSWIDRFEHRAARVRFHDARNPGRCKLC
jgi:hypothetical protein